jgi:acetyl esterase
MKQVPELHPDCAAFLAGAASLDLPAATVEQIRARYKTLCARYAGPPAPVAQIEHLTAPVHARLYSDDPAAPLLVWFHGGRMISGDLDTHDALCRLLVRSSGFRVLSVAYRLAPEHPYPAALEDAREALALAGTLSSKIALGGDSAGASLALSVALDATPPVHALVLVYPMIDAACSLPSHEEFRHGPGTSGEDIRFGYELWLPPGADPRDPSISPFYAPDLRALPQVFLLTAGVDPLRDEGLAFAERIRAAGLPLTASHEPDHIHGFLTYPARFEAAHRACHAIGRFLRASVDLPHRSL